MSTSGMIGEEIDKQLASASAALRNIAGADASASERQLLPRAVLDVLGPYAAAFTWRTALCNPPHST